MTKAELNAIYARPERYPFERLNALMQWAAETLSIEPGRRAKQEKEHSTNSNK